MIRNALLFAITLSSTFILGCWGATSSDQPAITLNIHGIYQTITGWEATATIGELDFPNRSHLWKDTLLDLTVNDLGINRVRLQIPAGAENDQDYFTRYITGQISRGQWRTHRYEIINDNNDPFSINWDGFQFSMLDHAIDNVILPLKQRLEAKGESLFINLNYVDFGSSGFEHKDASEEYAEFILAAFLHMQSKYGLVPDAVDVVLEPDNKGEWSGAQIGHAIVAAGDRLKAEGFSPVFIAPSNMSMAHAITWFDQMVRVPGALQYLSELSYHRYSGVSDANLRAIAARAAQYRIKTSMLEHIGSGHEDLHEDLKTGMNSAWQQFTLAFPGTRDNGGAYYRIDGSDPDDPKIIMGGRTKFLRQYFRYIRRGAVRIEATSNNNNFDPVAFVNRDGKYVVVVKANRGGSFALQGLAAGTYGIKYTTVSQYDVDAADVNMSSGQALTASIPERGVITVYAKAAYTP